MLSALFALSVAKNGTYWSGRWIAILVLSTSYLPRAAPESAGVGIFRRARPLILREVSFTVISLLFFRLRKSLAAYVLHLFLLLGRQFFGAGPGLNLADVSPTSFPRNVRAGSPFNFSPGLT